MSHYKAPENTRKPRVFFFISEGIKWEYGSETGKPKVSFSGAQKEIFHGRGGFMESGHFDKYFIKKHIKKDSAKKNLGVFSSRYS